MMVESNECKRVVGLSLEREGEREKRFSSHLLFLLHLIYFCHFFVNFYTQFFLASAADPILPRFHDVDFVTFFLVKARPVF